MKYKILLLVILITLIPNVSADASIFVNQTIDGSNFLANSAVIVNQTFTTPSYLNASVYKLDYIQVWGAGVIGTVSVNVSVTNNTYTATSSALTWSVTPQYWQYNFSDVYLTKNSGYAFNITTITGTSSIFYSPANPYAGGRASDSSNTLLATDDLQFIIGLEPHDNVGSWKFNEGSGNFANDSSGFNNNGTLSTIPPIWSTNLVNGSVNGTSLSFYNAVGVNVTVPTNESLNLTNGITITGWFKNNRIDGNYHRLMSKMSDTPFNGYELLLNPGGSLFLETGKGTGAGGLSTNFCPTTVNENNWYFFTATYNGTYSTCSINNDGVHYVLNVNGVTTTPNNMSIGSWYDGSFPFNGTLDEFKVYNYVLNSTEITTEFQRFQPTPAYPVGGIVIPAVYPPLQTSVTFSWYDTVYPSDEIQIAEDVNFNIMVHDGFHSTDSATVNLDAGKTYYWRVKQFNSTTSSYGNTSLTQTFTISSPPAISASGSAVQGIVYEIINGVQTPVSGSTVYLSNSTASFTFVTSSNGYFLFQNLAPNSTYSIYATNAPVYNPTSVFPITTTATAGTVTSNLLITRFFSPFVPNYVYEKFIVRNLFDTKFPGVTVNVFTDGDITPLATKTTDSMGQAVFQLIKDTYYRVEFSGGGLSSTITIFIYGKEEEYEVLVLSGVPTTNVTTSQVSANLSNSTVNSTFTNLTLLYSDASLTTTQVNFFVYNNTNGSMTLISYQTFLNTNSIFTGYAVNSGGGNSYVWGYNATTQYGVSGGVATLTFGSHLKTTLTQNVNNWIAIILLTILVSMFSKRNVKLGAIVVPAVAFILSLPPWAILIVNPIFPATCLILGVLYYMRRSEIQVAT